MVLRPFPLELALGDELQIAALLAWHGSRTEWELTERPGRTPEGQRFYGASLMDGVVNLELPGRAISSG